MKYNKYIIPFHFLFLLNTSEINAQELSNTKQFTSQNVFDLIPSDDEKMLLFKNVKGAEINDEYWENYNDIQFLPSVRMSEISIYPQDQFVENNKINIDTKIFNSKIKFIEQKDSKNIIKFTPKNLYNININNPNTKIDYQDYKIKKRLSLALTFAGIPFIAGGFLFYLGNLLFYDAKERDPAIIQANKEKRDRNIKAASIICISGLAMTTTGIVLYKINKRKLKY